MSLIRYVLGRRQFLFAFISSSLTLVFGGFAGAFDLLFKSGAAKATETPPAGGKKPLKGIVVYYSATGNTAQVANAIYKGMKSVITCDVAPINKVKPADMAKYDVMALGAPNWYERVPGNVLIFTHNMPRMDGKHCIIFGTHGGMPFGQFWIMSKNVLKKGMTIIGWSDWYGSDFLTPHSSVGDGEWGHPDSIDLAEAEAFGRQMALNSIRIYAGEKDLLPDRIPSPDVGSGDLWAPHSNGGKISFAGGAANGIPNFDFTKCVYPRCNRCIENCPVSAIDFSVIAPLNSIRYETVKTKTDSPVVLKEACQQCGGVCEKVCTYGAITYLGTRGVRVFQDIDMTKCIYPKCTVCKDLCPQDAVDVTRTPAIVHNWCENECLCFGVCPENAIGVTPTSVFIDEGVFIDARARGQRIGLVPGVPIKLGTPGGQGAMAGEPGGGGGPGEGVEMAEGMGGYGPRFRSLVQEEGVNRARVIDLTVYPRIPIVKELWPYHMDEK